MPYCQKCGKEYLAGAPMCGYCGTPTGEQPPADFSMPPAAPYVQPAFVQPVPQAEPKRKKKTWFILFIVILFIVLVAVAPKSSKDEDVSGQKNLQAGNSNASTDSSESAGTYEKNNYFEVVDTAKKKNILGDTIIIDKVSAKKNAKAEATVIAYASDGSVIDKATDDIILTEGKDNYFNFYFDGDVTDSRMEISVSFDSNYHTDGDRNAVELEKSNQSGDHLYLTVKQVSENLGTFAKYKILYYKGDKIVDSDWSYFSTETQKLNGIGSTDVIEIWTEETDYDRIEYIYEP